ncbi:transcription cofactor vestigial-like protein 4b isoform X2 [Paramormyrops kingsleyae]|uniref:transcription cofactor vestigial-like protein 4b isoform X2 n=1 Tax=Paramormyrops kingsleyae TaxID=1676925 RepID=UPI000CD5D314|nr:transcription cofactor vestigial-like protein 4 isoform X2 [Paramormyrops kingsleyae]
MLLTKMDLLNYQYLDKMNNNIGILCYEGEAALRGDPRMQPVSMSSAITNHRTGPPPISPSKRKHSGDQVDNDIDCDNEHVAKMSRLFVAQLGKPTNGDFRKDPRDRSRSPVERATMPHLSFHGNVYSHLSGLGMDQPLALTKNNVDAVRTVAVPPAVAAVERQQNRPSVITCASANNRNCNLSHCPATHTSCSSSMLLNYRRPPNSESQHPALRILTGESLYAPTCGKIWQPELPLREEANTACDPVIEEHFRRSLGKNYKEPEPVTNSVSITGSVDDHFAKALGETWLQIKAKGSSSGSSPESSPSSHMVNHSHSPSVAS